MKSSGAQPARRRVGQSLEWTAGDEAELPEQVDGWVGRDRLVAIVLETVSGIDRVRLQESGEGPFPLRAETMLTLLVFCYASGLRSSEAIEQALHEEATLQYLALNARPAADQFRRFRRRCRPLIQAVLAEVIEKAWQMRSRLALRDLEAAVGPPPNRSPCANFGAAPPFTELAERWVEQAVLVDSVARDL